MRPSDRLWARLLQLLEAGDEAEVRIFRDELGAELIHPALRSAMDAQLTWWAGDPAGALARLRQVASERRLGPHETVVFGLLCLDAGRGAEGRRALERVRALGVPDGRIHCALADLAIASGDLGTARRHLEDLLAIDPLHWRARLLLGTVAARIGDLEVALEQFVCLTLLVPQFEPGWTHAASLLVHLGHRERAGQLLLDAAKKYPNFTGVHLALVDVLAGTGRKDEALELLGGMVVRTEDPRLLMDLVVMMMEEGQLDAAAQALRSVAQVDPSSPRLAFLWGVLAEYRGEPKAVALGQYRRALELDPQLEVAQLALEALEALPGDEAGVETGEAP